MNKNKTIIVRIDEELYNQIVSSGSNISKVVREVLYEKFIEHNKDNK